MPDELVARGRTGPQGEFLLTGLPVGCVPCGLDAEGLPVGLQIVGPPLGEEAVLALAQAVQAAHPIGLPGLDGSLLDE